MATSTTNLGLTKPAGTDKIRIAQINGNMDIIDEKMGAVGSTPVQTQINNVQDGLAIVSNNNTHAAIAAGQFVYVKNHGTLAEGLYTANSAIAQDATLSSSNLTADDSGGLNALNDQYTNHIFKKLTTTTDLNSITDDGIYLFDWVASGTTYNRPGNTGGRLIHSTSTTGNSPGKQQTYVDYSGNTYVRGYSSGSWTNWEQLALNSDKANILKGNISGNGSATLTITKPCFVVVGRASQSSNATTALIDAWSGIVYISNNTLLTLSISDNALTIANGYSSYVNYEVIY